MVKPRLTCRPPAATTRTRIVLTYGVSTITGLENKASSNYNALQVSLRKTVGSLSLSAAYTYSHSIDDSSDRYDGTFVNSYDVASSRASSNFDERHMLNVGYVYDLPFFRKTGLTHALLGGWQYSGIATLATGTPLTITNGTTFGDNAGVGNGVGTGSYPDLVGIATSNVPPQSALNSGSYSEVGLQSVGVCVADWTDLRGHRQKLAAQPGPRKLRYGVVQALCH